MTLVERISVTPDKGRLLNEWVIHDPEFYSEPLSGSQELHPTDRRLDALAKRLGRHESAHGQETHELRVEARRVDYAPRTLDPTWVLLNARSVALGQGAVARDRLER